MTPVDLAQFGGILATFVAVGISWGRNEEKLCRLEKDREKFARELLQDRDRFATKELLVAFRDETFRRLDRIETKQDKTNGNSK